MDRDTDLIPSSPTNSSPSSSDLDTESTSSFFPDRSTTLGTLMGVTLPPNGTAVAADAVRVPSRDRRAAKPTSDDGIRRRRRRRGSWWRLCRDDMVGSTSLGDFLQVERREFLYGDAARAEHVAVGGGPLFENGRVLPPPSASAVAERKRGRVVPVLLAGICSGGEG